MTKDLFTFINAFDLLISRHDWAHQERAYGTIKAMMVQAQRDIRGKVDPQTELLIANALLDNGFTGG